MTSSRDGEYEQRRIELLDRVHARRHELAQELVEQYRTVIDEYRALPDSVLMRDVFEVAVQNIENLVATFASGFEVDDDSHEWLRRSAARRVHQHVSLPSLLRTFRLWGNHLWRFMAELAGEDPVGRQVAVDAAAGMMTYVDQISVGVSRAYTLESADTAADGQTLRSDVLETLLGDEPVNERARRQVAVLGMRLRKRLLIVLVRTRGDDDPVTGVQAAVRAARDTLSPSAGTCLVGARGTEVVGICSAETDSEVTDLGQRADSLVASGRGWLVGIGRVHQGLHGVRQSYTEASEAVEIGSYGGSAERAVRFTDVLLDQILRSTRHTAALLDETIVPLADYDARKGSDLLQTLRAYTRANFNLTRAAAELSVNPNTIVYRLRRIHTLTGRDPASVDDLLLLALGLRLHDSLPAS